jgi:hypothetical protein
MPKCFVQIFFLDIAPSSTCMVDIETVHIEYRTSELYCDGQRGSVILEKSKPLAK